MILWMRFVKKLQLKCQEEGFVAIFFAIAFVEIPAISTIKTIASKRGTAFFKGEFLKCPFIKVKTDCNTT